MDSNISALLEQFHKLGEDGHLGDEVANLTAQYDAMSDDLARAVKYVCDLYIRSPGNDEGMEARDLIIQLFLSVYQDAKRKDTSVAKAFLCTFINDYPSANGSILFPRWIALADASLGFKNSSKLGNPSLIWQQASNLVLAYNEFLDGLLGILIVACRCAQGKTININVIGNNYGSKLDEFRSLTGGDESPFNILINMARPKLRNGIAHKNAWYDGETSLVYYFEGTQQKTKISMDLQEFLMLGYRGSYLAQAYVAFIAVVVIFESGDVVAQSHLPDHLLGLLSK